MQAPNLFDFATSELSQDAFICWLASWADPALKGQSEALHTTATGFLDRLLEVGGGPKPAEYRSIQVRRQWKNIDVLLIVNGDTAIIIEDKTDTEDPSSKLERYKKAVAESFPKYRIAAVYFKTGDQDNYRSVDKARYGRFLRGDFLDILDGGERAGVRNDIFADFHGHLRRIEEAVQSYQHVPVAEWGEDSNRWKGFFMALREQLADGEWDESGYPGGSAVSFRCWRDNKSKFLRLMGGELCFRIIESDKAQQSAQWDKWHQAFMRQNGVAGVKIKKVRCKLGRRMSVAVLDGDYRQANDQGLLDFERTMDVLKNAVKLMDAALGTV